MCKLLIDVLKPFDDLPNGPCDDCHRHTLCMVFQFKCAAGLQERHGFRLCVECLIEYAKRLSEIARKHSSISDLV